MFICFKTLTNTDIKQNNNDYYKVLKFTPKYLLTNSAGFKFRSLACMDWRSAVHVCAQPASVAFSHLYAWYVCMYGWMFISTQYRTYNDVITFQISVTHIRYNTHIFL